MSDKEKVKDGSKSNEKEGTRGVVDGGEAVALNQVEICLSCILKCVLFPTLLYYCFPERQKTVQFNSSDTPPISFRLLIQDLEAPSAFNSNICSNIFHTCIVDLHKVLVRASLGSILFLICTRVRVS